MAISSTLKLILPVLIVTLSGCALHELAYGTGSIIVQYDSSTGVCQIDVNYKGNHHQQKFITGSDRFRYSPLAIHAYEANSDFKYPIYVIAGNCIAHPDLKQSTPNQIEQISIGITLPSPSLEVEKNEILNGMTPRELAKTGFSVKFSDRNKPGVTSLPHIFDDETTEFDHGILEDAEGIAGIKQNGGPWCSQFTQIQSGTLHVFPEEEFIRENEDNAESLLPDGWQLNKWVFEGVVNGYNC